MVKLFFPFIVLFSAALLISCAGSPIRESTGQYIDSTTVTAKVKTRLLDMLGGKALPIKIKTFKNNVQLSGFVDNEAIKQRAGVIAAGTLGVQQVRNDLIVK